MTIPQPKKIFYLEDIAELQNGGAWKENEYADTGVCVVRVTDCQSGTIDLRSCKHLPITSFNKYSKHKLLSNDLVIATVGSHPTQPGSVVGRTSVVPQKASGALLNQNAVRVRAKNDILDQRFLNLFSKTEQFRNYIISHARGAANQVRMSLELLRKMPIGLPPLPTQRRIASILSAYDDLIENNTRRIAILEEMARRLYREWFVNFRFPGYETARFVETELGLVPEGWELKTVTELFEIIGGGTPSKSEASYWDGGNINWYSPSDLTRGKTIFANKSSEKITNLGLQKSSARLFPAYSVMLTSRATIGVIAINTTEACTNQGFITCLPNKRFPLWLLFHWLKENVELFISLGTGATFKEITKGTFKTIPLVLPQEIIIEEFSMLAEPMMKNILTLENQNSNLRAQRDLLLPKLISGELDVSEAEDFFEEDVV